MKLMQRIKPTLAARNSVTAFRVRSRIGRAVGKVNSRYSVDAVRVLPGPRRDQVLLQATDGHQAVCLVAPGSCAQSELVPVSVLPGRQMSRDIEVRLDHDEWRSSDGRLSPCLESESSFPPIADVLPAVQGSQQVTLGIDVSLLGKVADSFGTPKLTLMITLPPSHASHVNKPVAVCPADEDCPVHGVAVVMPLAAKHGVDYYTKVRKDVQLAESRLKSSPKPQGKPAA